MNRTDNSSLGIDLTYCLPTKTRNPKMVALVE